MFTLFQIPLLGAAAFDHKPKDGGVRPWREKRYAHLESAAEARNMRQQLSPTRGRENSINSRYSSDPVRFFKDRGLSNDPVYFERYCLPINVITTKQFI